MELSIKLQPKQMQVLELIENSPATFIGFGGSRGGAKSGVVRRSMLWRRMKYPKTHGLIFRRKFKELWANHIEKFFIEYPQLKDCYRSANHEIRLPNESVIRFGFAEHEHARDIESFQGQEFMDIDVDEATHLAEWELKFLKTCCRWPGMPRATCKMLMTMNPGNIGHAYAKRIFFDKKYQDQEYPEDYAFVQAYAWDNVEWVRAELEASGLTEADFYSWSDERRFEYFIQNSDYGRVLNSLPGSMRLGHLMGRWDVFAGQYFDIWDSMRMVRQPQEFGLKPWTPRWLSVDWGFAHPAAAYWHAQPGKTVTYRELVQNNLSPRALAAEIIRLNDHETLDAIYMSPDAFARRTDVEPVADQMTEVFREAGLPGCTPADNDRVGGWTLMYEMLKAGEWLIGANCDNLIDCIPQATRDDVKVEDLIKFDGDDALDSVRYGLKSRLLPRLAPIGERVAARIESETAHVDMSLRMVHLKKVEREEKQLGRVVHAPRAHWMKNRWRRQEGRP